MCYTKMCIGIEHSFKKDNKTKNDIKTNNPLRIHNIRFKKKANVFYRIIIMAWKGH